LIVKACDTKGAKDARLPEIIDWGDLHAGDPSADPSYAWSLFNVAGRQKLLEHYDKPGMESLVPVRVRVITHSSVYVMLWLESQRC
jgi:hypothetical protein